MEQSKVETNAVDDFTNFVVQGLLLALTDRPHIFTIGVTLLYIAVMSMIICRLEGLTKDKLRESSSSLENLGMKLDEQTDEKHYFRELYLAAEKCFIEKYAKRCRELVQRFPHLMNMKFESTGLTPFHRVCFNGNVSLIQLMLSKGANPRLNSDADESPLCLAVCYYLNSKNYESADAIACLNILREAGCNLDENGIWYDILLKMSIRAGNNNSLTEWLLINGRYVYPRRNTRIKREISLPSMMGV